jgi:hypothetical protein
MREIASRRMDRGCLIGSIQTERMSFTFVLEADRGALPWLSTLWHLTGDRESAESFFIVSLLVLGVGHPSAKDRRLAAP